MVTTCHFIAITCPKAFFIILFSIIEKHQEYHYLVPLFYLNDFDLFRCLYLNGIRFFSRIPFSNKIVFEDAKVNETETYFLKL